MHSTSRFYTSTEPYSFRVPGSRTACAAFTLVELLVVIATMGILFALVVPATSSIVKAGNTNQAVNGISLLLEQARTYAMANNTYVWVGFASDPTTGKLTVGAIAGTSGQVDDLTSTTTYTPIFRLQTYNQMSINTINGLPGMSTSVDDITSSLVSSFQQSASTGPVTFTHVLQYSPQGEATIDKTSGTSHWIQIGLQPVHGGNISDPSNVAAFQVATLTGQVVIYRP